MSKKSIYFLLKYDFSSVNVTDITFISYFDKKEIANEVKNLLTVKETNKNINYLVKKVYV